MAGRLPTTVNPGGRAALVALDPQDGKVLWRYDVEPMSYAWYLHIGNYLPRATSRQFVVLMQGYPPDKVAHWTGIAASDIRKLAREYATQRPAVIRVNYGIQRSERGGMSMRAVAMLPCLIGSWKEVGGGLQLSTSGAFAFNSDALEIPELMQKPLGRRLPAAVLLPLCAGDRAPRGTGRRPRALAAR